MPPLWLGGPLPLPLPPLPPPAVAVSTPRSPAYGRTRFFLTSGSLWLSLCLPASRAPSAARPLCAHRNNGSLPEAGFLSLCQTSPRPPTIPKSLTTSDADTHAHNGFPLSLCARARTRIARSLVARGTPSVSLQVLSARLVRRGAVGRVDLPGSTCLLCLAWSWPDDGNA